MIGRNGVRWVRPSAGPSTAQSTGGSLGRVCDQLSSLELRTWLLGLAGPPPSTFPVNQCTLSNLSDLSCNGPCQMQRPVCGLSTPPSMSSNNNKKSLYQIHCNLLRRRLLIALGVPGTIVKCMKIANNPLISSTCKAMALLTHRGRKMKCDLFPFDAGTPLKSHQQCVENPFSPNFWRLSPHRSIHYYSWV